MTIEEAREYWYRRLKRAEGYSDEHWDAEERHAHADYIDAMTHAITALAICREHEEAKPPKTNADRIRQMTDEELAEFIAQRRTCDTCCIELTRCITTANCKGGVLAWLRKEVSEDATERTD